MKRKLTFFIILFSIFSYTYAIDLASGNIKLTVEDNGLFKIYDSSENDISLLFKSGDTTYPNIKATYNDNEYYYKLNSKPTIVKKEVDKICVEHSKPYCTIKQYFSLIAVNNSYVNNAVCLDINIENTSDKEISIALRYLLDTYLGEKTNSHFIASKLGNIKTENELAGSYQDTWIQSKNDETFLQIELANSATKPENVIFSNWSKLDEHDWNFIVKNARTFYYLSNNKTSSPNDSAVALFYKQQQLRPGASRQIRIILSTKVASAPVATEQQNTSFSNTSFSNTSSSNSTYTNPNTVNAKAINKENEIIINKTKEYLEIINKAIETGDVLSEDLLKEIDDYLKNNGNK